MDLWKGGVEIRESKSLRDTEYPENSEKQKSRRKEK